MKISAVISELASTIVGAQAALDFEAQRDDLLWHEHIDEHALADELESIIRPLKGNLMRVSELSVKTDLSLEERRSSDISVGVSLLAKPVHSFYHRRYSESRSSRSQLELICVAAPVQPQTEQTPPNLATMRGL